MDLTQFRVLQDDPSPVSLAGGDVGVLLLHGFGGTPREMVPLADFLHAEGLTVQAPLLPGHGGTLADINRCRWRDWTRGVEDAYATLQTSCTRVFVGGFSMGSLLALWLAAHHPELKGMILYSPALKIANWRIALAPVARFFVKSTAKSRASDLHDPDAQQWLGGFDRYPVPAAAELNTLRLQVLRKFKQITVPALVIYAEGDASIHPDSGPETIRRLGAIRVPVESLLLHHSGHAVTVDAEWERVAATTYAFIQKRLRAAAN